MHKYERKSVTREESTLLGIECSRCKKFMPNPYLLKDTEPNDAVYWDATMKWQEIMGFSWTGGYGSPFGDSVHCGIDLCPDCAFEIFKDFYETRGER